jgi:hypothetical protein
VRQLSLLPQETWLQNGRFAGPLPPDAPIIVSNGVGVDSVALLVELHRLNLVPDAIVTALDAESLWLIVILEAHAQINLKKIRGLWGHGERMTEYITRRGLLPAPLVAEVWAKWMAVERPPQLGDNPEANADEVLFAETRRLATLCR